MEPVDNWLEEHPSFSRKDGTLEARGKLDIHLESPPPEEFVVALFPGTDTLAVHLNQHDIGTCRAHPGQLSFTGPGRIGCCLVEGVVPEGQEENTRGAAPPTTIRLLCGASVGEINAAESPRLYLGIDGDCSVDALVPGEFLGTVGVVEAHVGRIRAVRTDLDLGNPIRTDRFEAPGPLTITSSAPDSGRLITGDMDFDGKAALTLSGGAVLDVTGHVRLDTVTLDGAKCALMVRPGGLLEGPTRFEGSGRVVVGPGGRLVRPEFRGKQITVVVERGGEVERASGKVPLLDIQGGAFAGDPDHGVVIAGLKVSGDEGTIDGLNFFESGPELIGQLQQLSRVGAWWPKGRRAAVRDAQLVGLGLSESNQGAVRAHYWVSVERLLESKHAAGTDLVVAHHLAQDTKRRGAARWSPGWVLLTMSRAVGYSALIALPLLEWLAAGVLGATVLREVVDVPCMSGCSWLGLTWDVLVSPVSWIRPLDEGSVLHELTTEHDGARIGAFALRAFGTFTLAAAAVAVGRYLRPGK